MIAFAKYAQVSVKEKNIGDTKLQLKTRMSVIKTEENEVAIQKWYTKTITENDIKTTFQETVYKNGTSEDIITSIDGGEEDVDRFNIHWDEKWNWKPPLDDDHCILNQDNDIDDCEILNGEEKEQM